MYANIGEFINEKRRVHGMTLKSLSERLDISVTYLADIEKDRRNPMEREKLDQLASVLELTQAEKDEMYDLAGRKRREVAPDLTDYVVDNPFVSYALRRARDIGAGEEEWLKLVADLEKRTRRNRKKKDVQAKP